MFYRVLRQEPGFPYMMTYFILLMIVNSNSNVKNVVNKLSINSFIEKINSVAV